MNMSKTRTFQTASPITSPTTSPTAPATAICDYLSGELKKAKTTKDLSHVLNLAKALLLQPGLSLYGKDRLQA